MIQAINKIFPRSKEEMRGEIAIMNLQSPPPKPTPYNDKAKGIAANILMKTEKCEFLNREMMEFRENRNIFNLLGILPVLTSIRELNNASNMAIAIMSIISPE